MVKRVTEDAGLPTGLTPKQEELLRKGRAAGYDLRVSPPLVSPERLLQAADESPVGITLHVTDATTDEEWDAFFRSGPE